MLSQIFITECCLEWTAAALVTLSSTEAPYRAKLGSVGACKSVCLALLAHPTNETILLLLFGVVFELAREPSNRPLFLAANIIPTICQIYQQHANNVTLATAICRAIASLSYSSPDLASKLSDAGICGLITNGLKVHLFVPAFIQEACAAIFSLSNDNNVCKDAFGSVNAIDPISKALVVHKSSDKVVNQIAKSLRALTMKHADNQVRVSQSDILITSISLLRTHLAVESVVENLCWLIGNISYTGPEGVALTAPRRRNSVTVRQVDPDPTSHNNMNNNNVNSDRLFPSPKVFYNELGYWDTLGAALQTHFSAPNPVRWICAALGTFGFNSSVAHTATCELLISCLRKHALADNVVQKVD